ncbi:TPA: hypothetical protein NV714_002265 [Escherichia coli]|nr:hypothetical protein [Escherichia coli]
MTTDIKETIHFLNNELMKKKLTSEEKIANIYPVLIENPELININSSQSKYNNASIIYNSIIHCPELFDKIKEEPLFKIDYNNLNKDGLSLLHAGILAHSENRFKEVYQQINPEILIQLKDSYAKDNEWDSVFLLDYAIKENLSHIINFLSDNGFDINNILKHDSSPLVNSIREGRLSTFQAILGSGFNINKSLEDDIQNFDEHYINNVHLIDYMDHKMMGYHYFKKNPDLKKQDEIKTVRLQFLETLYEYGYDFSVLNKYKKNDFISKFYDDYFYQKVKKYGFKLDSNNNEDFFIISQQFNGSVASASKLKNFDVDLSANAYGFNIFSFVFDNIYKTKEYQGATISEEIKVLKFLLKEENLKPDYNSYVANYRKLNGDKDDYYREQFLDDILDTVEDIEKLNDKNLRVLSTLQTFSQLLTKSPDKYSIFLSEESYSNKDVINLCDYWIEYFKQYEFINKNSPNLSEHNCILSSVSELINKNTDVIFKEKKDEILDILVNKDSSIIINYSLFSLQYNNSLLINYIQSNNDRKFDWVQNYIQDYIAENDSIDIPFNEKVQKIFNNNNIDSNYLINIYDKLLSSSQYKEGKKYYKEYKENPREKLLILKSNAEKEILSNDLTENSLKNQNKKRL